MSIYAPLADEALECEARLFQIGLVLLAIWMLRMVLVGSVDPVDRENPGLFFEIYNWSVFLWIPAIVLLLIAGVSRILCQPPSS